MNFDPADRRPFRLSRTPDSLYLGVTLRGRLSLRQRRDYFRRMAEQARQVGVLMSHKNGLCIFYGAERLCTRSQRLRIIGWIIDQPERVDVEVGDIRPFRDFFDPALLVDAPAEDRAAARATVRRVAIGAMKQWVAYLQGHLA